MNKYTLIISLLIPSMLLNAVFAFLVFNQQILSRSASDDGLVQRTVQMFIPLVTKEPVGELKGQATYIVADNIDYYTPPVNTIESLQEEPLSNEEYNKNIEQTSTSVTELLQQVDVSLGESATYLATLCRKPFTNSEASDALNRSFVYMGLDDDGVHTALSALLTGAGVEAVIQDLVPDIAVREVLGQLCR